MTPLKITIPFTPRAKKSVRLGSRSWYNPSAHGMKQLCAYVKTKLLEGGYQMPIFPSQALLVIMHFKLPAPLSYNEGRRKRLNHALHVARPDGDNLEKFVNDALTGIIWKDDKQIVYLVRTKTITDAECGETNLFVYEMPSLYADECKNFFIENLDLGYE